MSSQAKDITVLLQQWRSGDHSSEERIFDLLLPDLHAIAVRHLRRERSGHSLQPTMLVNEAFLRLVKAKDIDWQDRGHFLALAARMMRRYLIDHARRRPEAQFVPWDVMPEFVLKTGEKLESVVAIDVLLDELDKESAQKRTLVELKFFLGLTDAEAAQAMHLTLRTFQREWHQAREWLFERMNRKP